MAYGATKGIIYYYYRNKSALFFAVQRRAMELTREAIEPHALADERPAVKLRRMAHDHTLLMMEHLAYLRVAAQGLELHLTGRTTASERVELEEILKLRAANEALYVRVIEEGTQCGDFRAMDAKLMAKPLLGALNWTSRWYHPRKNETAKDRERVADELASFAVSALLPHPQ
ncbi:hypothetical protein D3C85_1381640 [compost metagenome]